MATNRIAVPIDAKQTLILGTGGGGRERAEYVKGAATGAPMLRNGSTLYRLSGVAVSVAGVGMDGVTVETATQLPAIEAGMVFACEGTVELTVGAKAEAGFQKGDAPRASLTVSLYVERLVPKGSAFQALGLGRGDATASGSGKDATGATAAAQDAPARRSAQS